MSKRAWSAIAAVVLLFALAIPAMAAPLFPDVPENHWAKDAVAALAAKGLVEGYPDGTFKGDRAATRWEVAMIVARLLAKMEQEHATFATKAELEELRKLVNALKEELDALGVRVTNLEEQVSRLDRRVSELERITFYGSVEMRAVASSFTNTGNGDNAGGNGATLAGTAGYVDYNTGVGSYIDANNGVTGFGGAGFSPALEGVLPVVDLRNGRALTNGTGFSGKAILGLRVRITDDLDGGVEFAAFTSQGDQIVDAVWGVSAPFLSNAYTANTFSGFPLGTGQSLANTPFTRMNLDNFWLVHNPTGTKLILGSYSDTMMDRIIYVGEYNPNAFGPEYLSNYGFNVSGKVDVSDTGVFRWQTIGTRLGDGNIGLTQQYQNYAIGINVGFEFAGGGVKANFLRAANEASSGLPLTVGEIQNISPNGTALTNTNGLNWTPLAWVNPPGFYLGQLAAGQATGAGTTGDVRPIPGWGLVFDTPNPTVDATIAGAGGDFGPQDINLFGFSASYKWDVSEDTQIYIRGEYGHSQYRSNRNSSFTRDGDAGRAELGANLLDGDLDLNISFVTVDPTYDPFILQYPVTPVAGAGGFPGVVRLPDLNYFTNMYALHDTKLYPHNREGGRFNGQWRFNERRGLVWAKVAFYQQKRTSLYDVRVPAGAIAAAIPTTNVIGYAPGFIDPVFTGYAHPNIYPAGANSFDANLNPLEDVRGRVTNFGLGVSYKFDDPRLRLEGGWERNEFHRSTGLAPALGGSQNRIDLVIDEIHLGLGWEASDQWTLRGGVDLASFRGHYDPQGNYNAFAIANASTGFQNLDTFQTIPFLGFDYDISSNTQWSVDGRYYINDDRVGSGIFQGAGAVGTAGSTTHPFDWQGIQVTTTFKVKF
jgi:hypothetical protein